MKNTYRVLQEIKTDDEGIVSVRIVKLWEVIEDNEPQEEGDDVEP